LTLATIKSKMEDNATGVISKPPGAEVLLEYHMFGSQKPSSMISALEKAVRRYQYVENIGDLDVDAKPGMVAFMQPLLDGGFAPDNCRNNDVRAVNERVLKLKSEDLVITNHISRCMNEFVELFYSKAGVGKHSLRPVENDEVYLRQAKPTQRRILDMAQHESASFTAKNFVKKEAYGSANDPRMISQINGVEKMAYSAYMYTFCDLLKYHDWYAFGKTPRAIAERVVQICEQASHVDITDFSRMDGRVGNVARELEMRMMMYGFHPSFHLELQSLMRKQMNLKGITAHGVRYDTGLARSSGSAETSAFNTILNAFTCFLAYRRHTDCYGMYYDKEEAWRSLGIYGGDDGLSANLVRKYAVTSAASVGQKLELERVTRGNAGVSFLARHYGPGVWWGDANSCCDIKRQISKFHLTVHLPPNITREDKLCDKAFSFYLSDASTPILGEFVVKVLSLFDFDPSEYRNLADRWIVSRDASEQYPNAYDEWMDDLATKQLPEFDRNQFSEWVKSADRDSIFRPPESAPRPQPEPKHGIVVVDNDVVIVGENKAKMTQNEKDIPKKKFRPRKKREKSREPRKHHSSHSFRREAKENKSSVTTG